MNHKVDYLSNLINIGDTVIFTTNTYNALYTGVVSRFTKKKVVIKINGAYEKMRYSDEILIINK